MRQIVQVDEIAAIMYIHLCITKINSPIHAHNMWTTYMYMYMCMYTCT